MNNKRKMKKKRNPDIFNIKNYILLWGEGLRSRGPWVQVSLGKKSLQDPHFNRQKLDMVTHTHLSFQ
jgi:hypothetical protein